MPPRPTLDGTVASHEPAPQEAFTRPIDSGRPLSEEEKARSLAESVYRPRMERIAQPVRALREMARRYGDACMADTITTRSGARDGVSVGHGRSVGSSEGRGTYTDDQGNVVGYGSSRGSSESTWRETTGFSENWSEVTALDNSTTPQCRAMWSDMLAARSEIDAVMAEADREAVRQNVWTWMQTDVPRRLADEVWK
jgi:hypothetical protein